MPRDVITVLLVLLCMMTLTCRAVRRQPRHVEPCAPGCQCNRLSTTSDDKHSVRFRQLMTAHRLRHSRQHDSDSDYPPDGADNDVTGHVTEDVSGRVMTCTGLADMPKYVPQDVSSLKLYGQSARTLADAMNVMAAQPANGRSPSRYFHNHSPKFHQLTHLDRKSLHAVKDSIRELTVEGNRIKSIHGGDLQELAHLRKLRFRGNRLKMIRGQPFDAMRDLEDLDLSRNHLSWVGKSAFMELRQLKRLNLAKNKLRSFPERVFDSLAVLDELNLSNNELEVLNADVLRYNSRLRRFVVDRNWLRSLPDGLFSTQYALVYVSLVGNQLRAFPGNAFLGLPQSQLQEIRLTDNGLTTIGRRDLIGLPELRSLILTSNNLTALDDHAFVDVPQLEKLHVDHNQIEKLSAECLRGLRQLRDLSLSHNRITEIPAEVFGDLTRVERIDASHNAIARVRTRTFDGLHELRELRLDHNRIQIVESEAFAVGSLPSQTRLTWLYVDHNSIERLTRPMLVGLSYLKFLGIGHNQIGAIDVDAFQPAPRLSTLLVSDNRLSRLVPGVFKHLRALRHLNLASNDLEELPTNVFHGLERVEDITLDDNELTTLDASLFNSTTQLVSISARTNRLREADLRILDFADRLRHVDLAFNQISSVVMPTTDVDEVEPEVDGDDELLPPPPVVRRPGLTLLSLADNSLRTLDAEVVDAMNQDAGGMLRLDGNPWSCECSMSWLIEMLSAHRSGLNQVGVESPENVVCKSPSFLSNKKMQSLSAEDLFCFRP